MLLTSLFDYFSAYDQSKTNNEVNTLMAEKRR